MKKGSRMSEESRQNCSAAQMGHVVTQVTREKLKISHTGLGHTEETRKKLSSAAIRQHKLRPYESAYNTLRCNAKRRRLEFTLTFEDYLSIIGKGECFYCGAKLHWPEYNVRKSQASNLDRKDSDYGYITGNVVACCWSCNNIKSDHFNHVQFCEIGKLLRAWNFPGSVKSLPSYLNCVYCPSQAYLQSSYVDGLLAKYRCISKHEFYIPKETDDQSNSVSRNPEQSQ